MSSWSVTESGGEISCSIEETNRIRASLGLKPLQVTSPTSTDSSSAAAAAAAASSSSSSSSNSTLNGVKTSSETFIDLSASRARLDAASDAAARSAKLEREREVQAARMAPSLGEKLVAMGSAEASSAAEWVQMSRNQAAHSLNSGQGINQSKSSSGAAGKSSRLHATGASAAVFGEEKEEEEEGLYTSPVGGMQGRKRKREAGLSATYGSKDLAGLRIGHNAQDLTATLGDNQESGVVLTLRDTQLLSKSDAKGGQISGDLLLADPDGGDDELVNVQALDRERVSGRLEREKKSRMPVYSSVDELSKRKTGLLSQYDDEEEDVGQSSRVVGKKASLVISTEGGIIDTGAEARQRALALKALDDKTQTDLESSKPQLPTEKSDFYTEAEIAALVAAAKNKKKKKTLRKATGDDVEAAAGALDPSQGVDGIKVSDSHKIISDIRQQRNLVDIDGVGRGEGGGGGGDLGSRSQRRAQSANQALVDVAAASERGNKAFEAAYEKAALMTKARLGHIASSSLAFVSTSGTNNGQVALNIQSRGGRGGWVDATHAATHCTDSSMDGQDVPTETLVDDPAQLAVRNQLRSAAEAARRAQASNLNKSTHQRAYSRLRSTGGGFDDGEGEADDAELQAALSRARRLAVKTDIQPSSATTTNTTTSRAGIFVGGDQHLLNSDDTKSGEGGGLLVFNDVSGFSSKLEVQQLSSSSSSASSTHDASKSEQRLSAVPEVALVQPMNGSSKKDDMDVEGDVDDDEDDDGGGDDDDDMEIEGDDDMDVDEEGVREEDSAVDHDASESTSDHQHSIQGIAGALQLFQRTGAINSKKSDVQLKGRTKDKRDGDLVVPVAEVGGGTKFYGGGTTGKLDTFVIEYKDDQGKKLTTKEAYRQLSYKFHGKMPSKNVLDKRLKKAKREEKLAKASANEAPDSLKLFQKAQQNSAYVVIG